MEYTPGIRIRVLADRRYDDWLIHDAISSIERFYTQ
jgi:hypothetical protein